MQSTPCDFQPTGRIERGLPRWQCRRCPNYQLAHKPGLAACRGQVQTKASRGLGDTVRKVTDFLKIPHCRGCDERQAMLNNWFPYATAPLDPGPSTLDSVLTAGITAFERPQHLARCAASLRARYPMLRVIVADSGRARPELPEDVEAIQLPYDAGLSAARNALVAAARTPYVLIAEDDFVFTETARVEALVDVLEHDPSIDVAGGSVILPREVRPGAFDFTRAGERLQAVRAARPLGSTPRGTAYRPCDKVANFLTVRRNVAVAHPWPEELKVGEHAPWFWLLHQAGRRVAHVPSVGVVHDTTGRTPDYNAHRLRARDMRDAWFAARGIARYEQAFYSIKTPHSREARPNIVVLGVGHSGTTILVRMLGALGWHTEGLDDEYAEPPALRERNAIARRTGQLPEDAHTTLPTAEPWIVKDPRFVWTLGHWLPVFRRLRPRPPLLVWITRAIERTAQSYVRRRRFGGDQARAVAAVTERHNLAAAQFARWPWAKIHIDYDQLKAAAALFDVARG